MLEPMMRADEATKAILLDLLTILQANAPQIIQDVDPEYLHNFRVAIRRTRTLLTQMNGVLPPQKTAYFKKNLKHLGRSTNYLRDLDVYLLQLPTYQAQLPESLQDDLQPFWTYLQEKRDPALGEVTAELQSAHYKNIIQDWELFLREPVECGETAVNAAEPILPISQQRIYHHYKHIVQRGPDLVASQQADQWHILRIECKKLRYLLTFYASLYPPHQMTTLIDQLTLLQDNLGRLNDLHIQESYLFNAAVEMPLRQRRARHTLLAIGGLLTFFDAERYQQKAELPQTFAAFISPEMQALFRTLFT